MARPKFESKEDFKKWKAEKHEEMVQKQNAPYSVKVKMAKDRIKWFVDECDRRGLNCHVSVGGPG